MNILIITANVGRTAPGIVFERLIQGLSEIHVVDVVTADLDSSVNLSGVRNILEIKQKKIHPRIFKMLISVFGISPFDWLWSKRAISRLKENQKKDYEVVFSFISFHHYISLLTGFYYSKLIRSKFAVYSVDAIPAPLGWSKDNAYFRRVKKMMKRYLSEADFFFSANEQMLKYQFTTFRPKTTLVTEVIYNPNNGKLQEYETTEKSLNTFLYTGGIYGPRKPIYLLGAFKILLKEYPNTSLQFVGSNFPESYLSIFTPEEKKKISFHPFSRDLKLFYERATALIDIDADLPNDVFLSSKITNYLSINRIIISETGENSPSREIFKEIPSILQCNHDIKELAAAMRKAILEKDKVKFNDREKVISTFALQSVTEKINKAFNEAL